MRLHHSTRSLMSKQIWLMNTSGVFTFPNFSELEIFSGTRPSGMGVVSKRNKTHLRSVLPEMKSQKMSSTC
jgi:hypothetical protein